MEACARWATATRKMSFCPRRSRPLLASASSLCRLGTATAWPSPPTAPSGAGEMETTASWATATSGASCCPRRTRLLLASAFVVAVSAGGDHSLALAADGAVWSWGWGDFGNLGHGDEQNQLLPKKLEALASRRVVAVSAAAVHSLALTAPTALSLLGEKAIAAALGRRGLVQLAAAQERRSRRGRRRSSTRRG